MLSATPSLPMFVPAFYLALCLYSCDDGRPIHQGHAAIIFAGRGHRMHGAGIALALTLASFLSTRAALAERGINFDLYRIESVTEYPSIQYVPMFDGAGCPVDESTVENLLRAELQRDRGIKLRFVFMREFDERKKELYDRPTKIHKQFPANFDFWKDALRVC